MLISQAIYVQLVGLTNFDFSIFGRDNILQGAFEPFKNSDLPHLSILQHEVPFDYGLEKKVREFLKDWALCHIGI